MNRVFQPFGPRCWICFSIVCLTLFSSGYGQAPGAAGAKTAAAKTITNSIGMKLILIPAGEFMMGNGHAPDEEVEAMKPYGIPADLVKKFIKDEYPQHRVRITKPFYLGSYEVTVGQFRKFVEDTGYKTDAEKETGGTQGAVSINPATGKVELKIDYSWRNAGFEQTDEHPVLN